MCAAGGDDVEQVTMIASRGVSPFARRAATIAIGETHIKTAPKRIALISDHPIMAFAVNVREVLAASRLGIFTETTRKCTDRIFHSRAPTGGLASSCPLDRKLNNQTRVQLGARRLPPTVLLHLPRTG